MMTFWDQGDIITIRNIARSDGTVTTATPAIVIQDGTALLVVYIPQGTLFKNNWMVPSDQRVAAVGKIVPSAQRRYEDIICKTDSLRLYLAGHGYSVGLTFDEVGRFVSWYGNLEAPFVRTRLGIDTRDFALDIVADHKGHWRWKDEAEFRQRLVVGLDSVAHQAKVWAAGHAFIERLEQGAWPFNAGWDRWQPPLERCPPKLPEDWAVDLGSHEYLELV